MNKTETPPTKNKKDISRECCWWIAVPVMLVLLFMVSVPQLLCSRRAAWASRAKGTLRSIGSSELAYKSGNRAKRYGSFQALQKSDDIAEGYTLGNMIENYSMTWEAETVSTVEGEKSTFTVIAWPEERRNRTLLTFAVTEDTLVRVYNPKNPDNHPGEVKSWDPIL
jgi:hypothetical protein